MKSLWKFLFIGLLAGSGMSAGYFVGGSIKHFPEVKNRVSELSPLDGVLMVCSFLLVLAVHELGHLAGAKLQAMRFLLFIVGPFQCSRSASGIHFNLVWNLGTFGGLVAATPHPDRPLKPQLITMISGGPLASLILAGFGFVVFATAAGPAGLYGLCICFLSGVIFLVTAVPSKVGGFMSDGMQLIEVCRGSRAVLFRQQFTTLYAQSLAGVRPRDWDQQLLSSILLCSEGMDGLRQTGARYLGFLSAIDRGDTSASDTFAEWLAAHYSSYPVGMRQGLTLELCLYALQKGNVASAREWHSKSSGGILDKSRRSLADAWLAFLDGRDPDATRKILASRSQLRASMDPGVAVMTKERLDLLENEMQSKLRIPLIAAH